MTLFISTIIPTVGRDTLSRAVQSVLDQRCHGAEFEVIVVNDSGRPLSRMSWMDAPNLQILNTNRHERSVARNAGAAAAQGRYLHFLDDDDWILPDAFRFFQELIGRSAAGMYYGGYRFVDSNGNTLDECHPNEHGNCFIRFMSGEWQPLQASLFDARLFHSLGGFAPLDALRGGDEDVDLTRRVSLHGNIAGIQKLTAVIRIDREESTTKYSNLQEQSRQSRELVLDMPGAYARLRHSARERCAVSGYWPGRMAWIYLGSVAWNIKQRKFLTALDRLAKLGLAILQSFKYWFSPGFWRGATRPHQAHGWLVSG
jgi:hypothetical protein